MVVKYQQRSYVGWRMAAPIDRIILKRLKCSTDAKEKITNGHICVIKSPIICGFNLQFRVQLILTL